MGGGGPLMDMGIYSLNTIRFYTGTTRPLCGAHQHHGPPERPLRGHRGIDISWTMELSSGVLANCGPATPHIAVTSNVIGSRGNVQVTTAYSYDGLHLDDTWTIPDGKSGTDIHEDATGKMPFQFQIEGGFRRVHPGTRNRERPAKRD